LTWAAAHEAADYQVYRQISGGQWELVGTTTATSYTDSTITADGSYRYGVLSRNGSGSSARAETSPVVALTAAGDYDRDGIQNLAEHSLGTNPANFDSDGDLLPDGWEVTYAFNPLSSDQDHNGQVDYRDDADGDGLDNLGEYNHFTSPILIDTDGDGASDSAEVNQGSDPR
jgi:hypothetical protein